MVDRFTEEYRKKNNTYQKAYYKKRTEDPEFLEKLRNQKRARTLAKYGVEPERIKMVLEQNSCDSCGTKEPGGKLGWHFDHDHETGQFRGVLCTGCNVALGMVNDDAEKLKKLAKYIEDRKW